MLSISSSIIRSWLLVEFAEAFARRVENAFLRFRRSFETLSITLSVSFVVSKAKSIACDKFRRNNFKFVDICVVPQQRTICFRFLLTF